MTPNDSLQRPEGCPDLEDIAALVEGTLDSGERARLLQHLAGCPDCYEIFAGAARFHLDSPQDSHSAAAAPIPFRRKRGVAWIGLAAAALLTVAVGLSGYRSITVPPMFETGDLTPSPLSGRLLEEVWTGKTTRGMADESPEARAREDLALARERAFQLGVQATNLWVSLRAQSSEEASKTARDATQRIGALLKEEDFFDDVAEDYGSIRSRIDRGHLLQDLSRPAGAAEYALRTRLAARSFHFDFGRWTEAGFLAALAENPDFFRDRKARRFARAVRWQKEEQVDPEAVARVEVVRKLMKRSPLTQADYRELEEALEAILQIYYPYTRSSSLKGGLAAPAKEISDPLLL